MTASQIAQLVGDLSYLTMSATTLIVCLRRDVPGMLVCAVNLAIWLSMVVWVRLAFYPLDVIEASTTNVLAGMIGFIFLCSILLGLARRHEWT